MYSYGAPHMAKQKQDDQHEHTYSSYGRIRDETLKTSQKRWMIGRSGERGPGISVLAAWHDDDDDDELPLDNSLWHSIWMTSGFKLTSARNLIYLFILRPTTGQIWHKDFFKVGPDAGPQSTRVRQNQKIPSAPSAPPKGCASEARKQTILSIK